MNDHKYYLAINRRAIYSLDDFLISRHHMHLMVYFHHKSIIYEEMLNKYLSSPNCSFNLPSDLHAYTLYNDYRLHEHLAAAQNPWAQRIAQRKPYKVLIELHNTQENQRPLLMKQILEKHGIDVIWASSKARLSKYHSLAEEEKNYSIYVVDQYDKLDHPTTIDQSSEIFKKYEGARIIDRIYVSPEDFSKAQKTLQDQSI